MRAGGAETRAKCALNCKRSRALRDEKAAPGNSGRRGAPCAGVDISLAGSLATESSQGCFKFTPAVGARSVRFAVSAVAEKVGQERWRSAWSKEKGTKKRHPPMRGRRVEAWSPGRGWSGWREGRQSSESGGRHGLWRRRPRVRPFIGGDHRRPILPLRVDYLAFAVDLSLVLHWRNVKWYCLRLCFRLQQLIEMLYLHIF